MPHAGAVAAAVSHTHHGSSNSKDAQVRSIFMGDDAGIVARGDGGGKGRRSRRLPAISGST